MNHPLSDSIFQDHESLAMATSSSIVGRIAFGPNAGKKVTRIGSGFGYYEEIPLAKGHRCFSINGFSLHANTATNTLARDSLRKLVEYISRGPVRQFGTFYNISDEFSFSAKKFLDPSDSLSIAI